MDASQPPHVHREALRAGRVHDHRWNRRVRGRRRPGKVRAGGIAIAQRTSSGTCLGERTPPTRVVFYVKLRMAGEAVLPSGGRHRGNRGSGTQLPGSLSCAGYKAAHRATQPYGDGASRTRTGTRPPGCGQGGPGRTRYRRACRSRGGSGFQTPEGVRQSGRLALARHEYDRRAVSLRLTSAGRELRVQLHPQE